MARQSSALARLAECIVVKIDGTDVRVPIGNAENKVLNCLLVSRARTLVEDQIKRYNEKDVTLTPRELKDLIDSVARMSEASADVYEKLDVTLNGESAPKSPDPVENAAPVTEVNFDEITRPTEKKTE